MEEILEELKAFTRKRGKIFLGFLVISFLILTIYSLTTSSFHSTSVIQIGSVQSGGISPAEAKNLLISGVVTNEVVEKYYPNKSMKRFSEQNIEVEILTESTSRLSFEVLPYLRITTIAEERNVSEAVNSDLIASFFEYANPIYESRISSLKEQIKKSDEIITALEAEIQEMDNKAILEESEEASIINELLSQSILLNKKELLTEQIKIKNSLQKDLQNAKEFKIITEPEAVEHKRLSGSMIFLVSLFLSLILTLLFVLFIEK